MAFTCPCCGMTSHHPEDERQGYCGNCHDWTGEAMRERERNWVTDPANPIGDELWEAATDDSLPPGVIKVNGCPYPLAEFMGCEMTPWQLRLAEMVLNSTGPVRLYPRTGKP